MFCLKKMLFQSGGAEKLKFDGEGMNRELLAPNRTTLANFSFPLWFFRRKSLGAFLTGGGKSYIMKRLDQNDSEKRETDEKELACE